MKPSYLLAAASLAIAAPLSAQMPDEGAMIAEQREAMEALSWMDGTWEGTVTTQTPEGPVTYRQTENISPIAGGTVRVIEGRGFDEAGELKFNAAAMIVYDAENDEYGMIASARGRATQPWFKKTDNGFEWGFETGPVKISYIAVYDDGVWSEEGFMAFGEAPPAKFLEMRLERTGGSE
ncbi:hypothetical protein NAP1_03925 [Erythrobacter sp. NAP1]|uniref:hypothetical protein n=1 Tax=Erythrobacter sp. NAP1 TaxID=237727 RepID=UPI0000686EDA|nr:hypothetical protein [Erythrobacter sp. NAP1]EAQ29891.1 hypothetical protein NAP1_03925 [Erythrobacter sp. NAP1]